MKTQFVLALGLIWLTTIGQVVQAEPLLDAQRRLGCCSCWMDCATPSTLPQQCVCCACATPNDPEEPLFDRQIRLGIKRAQLHVPGERITVSCAWTQLASRP
jgi:hypothetical protein